MGVLLGAVSVMVGQQVIAFGWQWHSVTIGLALEFSVTGRPNSQSVLTPRWKLIQPGEAGLAGESARRS